MGEKILVVDDERHIVDALKIFLEIKGYNVLTATSAIEGINLVETEKPKIVFLDINMPEMTGIEALKKIKAIDNEIGVIMATAVIDENVAKQAIELGASDYIIKPFDLHYLEKSLMVKLATML